MSKSSLFNSFYRALQFYKVVTPSFGAIQSLYNYQLKADHIAIRTFKGIGGIEHIKNSLITDNQCISGGALTIPEKKLNAEWFYTTTPEFRVMCPRIFVSEIDEIQLSEETQNILNKYLNSYKINKETSLQNDLFDFNEDAEMMWGIVEEQDYNFISNESEYAAWTLLNGHRVNHLAVHVTVQETIQEMVDNLKNKEFIINQTGGEIKTSSDGMLHQASTMSDTMQYQMIGNDNSIIQRKKPGCFVEFVQRDKYPGGSIREGFEANNALHIFDSTRVIENSSFASTSVFTHT